MSGRRETGVNPDITKAITDAIVVLEHDRSQERTAVNLAKLAGTSRPTLYRAFNDRPDLRAAFERLTNSDRLTGEQRTQAERRIIELRAENAQLRRLVAALTTVAEALKREPRPATTPREPGHQHHTDASPQHATSMTPRDPDAATSIGDCHVRSSAPRRPCARIQSSLATRIRTRPSG